jgi:hypothetical protein
MMNNRVCFGVLFRVFSPRQLASTTDFPRRSIENVAARTDLFESTVNANRFQLLRLVPPLARRRIDD